MEIKFKILDLILSIPQQWVFSIALTITFIIYHIIFGRKILLSTKRGMFIFFIIQMIIYTPIDYIRHNVKHVKIDIEPLVMESPLYAGIIKYHPEERQQIIGNIILKKPNSEQDIKIAAKSYEQYYFMKYVFPNAYKLSDDKLAEFVDWNKYFFRNIKTKNPELGCEDNIKNGIFFDYPENLVRENSDVLFGDKEPTIISQPEFDKLFEPLAKKMDAEIADPKNKYIYGDKPDQCMTSILLLNTISKEGTKTKIDMFRYLYRYKIPPKQFVKS